MPAGAEGAVLGEADGDGAVTAVCSGPTESSVSPVWVGPPSAQPASTVASATVVVAPTARRMVPLMAPNATRRTPAHRARIDTFVASWTCRSEAPGPYTN